jgi:RNA ligase
MKYVFPVIKNIKQAREAIKDRPEFIEANRDDYIVFNYILSHDDSFDDPMRRELRGLIFNRSGDVLSRRFHKFFNMNEKDETQSNNIDWNQPHVVLEKLDGSMITPLVLNGDVRWATKMGITEVSLQCEEYIKDKFNYYELARDAHKQRITPIFEFIAPDNRIVISYEEPKLILLALRNNLSGMYYSLDMMKYVSEQYNIPMIKTYSGDISNIREQIGIEGVVVRFNDGHMIKVKTDWYVAIHRAKDQILFEKNVIKLILEENIDDILPNLLENDKI